MAAKSNPHRDQEARRQHPGQKFTPVAEGKAPPAPDDAPAPKHEKPPTPTQAAKHEEKRVADMREQHTGEKVKPREPAAREFKDEKITAQGNVVAPTEKTTPVLQDEKPGEGRMGLSGMTTAVTTQQAQAAEQLEQIALARHATSNLVTFNRGVYT